MAVASAGYMQVCTSLQTDNHASTSPLSFLQAGCPSCRPTNSVKAVKGSSPLEPLKQNSYVSHVMNPSCCTTDTVTVICSSSGEKRDMCLHIIPAGYLTTVNRQKRFLGLIIHQKQLVVSHTEQLTEKNSPDLTEALMSFIKTINALLP